MNCKKARELIITDFLDSEIHERERSRLEAHIGGCYDCTEYARAARAAAVEPFDAVIKTVPPERVWRGVLKNITAREERPAGSV
ncbi:MAG: zf-HC2 domain-containing protein, partial [Candidatus Omnitrophota bacterium]